MLGWVFFRTSSLGEAITFFRALIGFDRASVPIPFAKLPVMGGITWISLIAGIILCLPIGQWLSNRKKQADSTEGLSFIISLVGSKLVLITILIISLLLITASGFQATIYSRF
jgi:lipid-A-disaccharide synthase-like uncharacterized protein